MTARTEPGNAAWWCLLFVLCLALLAPLTLAEVPPLLDYPNHLARLFVLAALPGDPVLARFYQMRWGIIPNLALDLTVPPLLRMFPVHLVGRAVVALTLLLPVMGAAAYHRALIGRLSYWPLGSALFAYNGALLRGFLNFIASVGLALLLGAVWVAWRERRPSVAIAAGAIGATALFFCHLAGLLCFAILIAGHEVAALRRGPPDVDRIVRRIAALGLVFGIPVVLYLMSDLQTMQGEAAFRSVAEKARAALIPAINYLWPLDLTTAAFCVAVPAICLARRWCVVPFQAALAIVVLLALYVVSPAAFKGTYDLDTRFIVMAAFIVPAALMPVALPRAAGWAIGTGFVLLFSARMALLATVWHNWAGDLAAFRSVIKTVQPGDVVLTFRPPRNTERDYWTSGVTARRLSDGAVTDTHLPALLLIEHRAWWPFLFDNLSQQPIETRQPYRALASRIDNSDDPIGLLLRDVPEMRPVTHVLVMGGAEAIDAGGLSLIARNGDAALYAVTRNEFTRSPLPPPDR